MKFSLGEVATPTINEKGAVQSFHDTTTYISNSHTYSLCRRRYADELPIFPRLWFNVSVFSRLETDTAI